jgi:hypothetical protein
MKIASRSNLVAALLVLLAWSMIYSHACIAADYTKVGLNVGNTADYQTSVTGRAYNRTHLLVYGIVGTVIYGNFTDYNPDNTVNQTYQIIGDILLGSNNIFFFFTAANLTAGDPIYSGASWTINETITMTVAGTSRTVNHIRTADGLFEAYWDKATGLMTKLNAWYIYWFNMTIISTNAWSAPLPPPSAPLLSVELSGGFDYGDREDINLRLAALVRDPATLKPISGANVIVQIYYPNGTLWTSGVMLEKLAGTGIYEWQSIMSIAKMKLAEGVYLVHAKVYPVVDSTGSDMLLFHIDPPPENDSPPTSMPLYVASAIALAAGATVGTFLFRRHKRGQAAKAKTIELPYR